MKILIISIINNGTVNPNIANVITAANQIDAPIDILLIGSGLVESTTSYPNLNKIMQISCADDLLLSTNIAKTIAKYAKDYTHVLMASDSNGKDILPRVAGILDASQISEVMKVCSPNIFKRPIYASNIIAEVESFDEIKLLTIRPTSFDATVSSSKTIAVVQLDDTITKNSNITKLSTTLTSCENGEVKSSGLTLAKRVVSGGKSLGSQEEFDRLIRGLAKKIDAAVGASRDAVETGLAKNDCQVGQTGKVIAPNLYIPIGISGAVQHIAGMKDSKTVLAINIDPTAQIFEYSDYGFEGDLFEVIPQLIEKL